MAARRDREDQRRAAPGRSSATPVIGSKRIWVLNGPNLNLLGTREPEIYGSVTLEQIDRALIEQGVRLGVQVTCFQSNIEGELVTRIQLARDGADALILNPGAYAHTSLAIRDALSAVKLPAVEVHLSNVHQREAFRHTLMTAAACLGVIAGLGPLGYQLALGALASRLLGDELPTSFQLRSP